MKAYLAKAPKTSHGYLSSASGPAEEFTISQPSAEVPVEISEDQQIILSEEASEDKIVDDEKAGGKKLSKKR